MSLYYKDKLYPLQDRVLESIDKLKTPFYLTGGTALSRCYFDYRYSDDLDFFVNDESSFVNISNKVVGQLDKQFQVKIVAKSESYYSLMVEKILKVEFVNDVAHHFGGFEKKKIFSKVDNLMNILSNKISALISRDEVKDVVDIWMIAKNIRIDWKKIYKDVDSKAVGICVPDVARKLVEFSVELLDEIKWRKNKKPDKKVLTDEFRQISELMLKV